jgi:hypothetical protein
MGAVDYWFIRHAATLIRSPAAIEVIAVTAASREVKLRHRGCAETDHSYGDTMNTAFAGRER